MIAAPEEHGHDEQPLANRGAEGIQAEKGPVRVFLLQLFNGHLSALNGFGHAGGEAQIQYILSFFRNGFKMRPVSSGVDLRGGSELTAGGGYNGAECLVKKQVAT